MQFLRLFILILQISTVSMESKNEVNYGTDINQANSSTQSGSEELKQCEDREVHLCNSFQPQSQAAEQETDTNAFCGTGQSCIRKQLQENILAIGSKDMNQPPKHTKAHLSNYDSGPQLAEKMDSKIFCDKPARPKLLMSVSPVGSRPPPQFEEDTNTYLPNCESQTAGRGTSETLYDNAGSYVSEQLVKTAVAAGEKQTVMAKTKKPRFDQGIKTKKEVTDTKFVVVLLEELLQFVEEKKAK